MMSAKAASLMFLRVSTGLLLVIWGLIKLGSPDVGVGISEKYYGGAVSVAALQMPWGALQILVGLLVCAGLFRRIVYPVQAVMLCIGALAIWRYLLDPLGLYLLDAESRQVLFFPSLAVAAATLVLLAFRDDDTLSLDMKFGRRYR
jgi:uncharacterized membrane protein YphA (DoxX/SURF4 family)